MNVKISPRGHTLSILRRSSVLGFQTPDNGPPGTTLALHHSGTEALTRLWSAALLREAVSKQPQLRKKITKPEPQLKAVK
jgi:hypothetical protein